MKLEALILQGTPGFLIWPERTTSHYLCHNQSIFWNMYSSLPLLFLQIPQSQTVIKIHHFMILSITAFDMLNKIPLKMVFLTDIYFNLDDGLS